MENFASVGTMEEQHRHIGETILTITIGLITIIISLNVKFSLNICLAVKRYFQLGSEKTSSITKPIIINIIISSVFSIIITNW